MGIEDIGQLKVQKGGNRCSGQVLGQEFGWSSNIIGTCPNVKGGSLKW